MEAYNNRAVIVDIPDSSSGMNLAFLKDFFCSSAAKSCLETEVDFLFFFYFFKFCLGAMRQKRKIQLCGIVQPLNLGSWSEKVIIQD